MVTCHCGGLVYNADLFLRAESAPVAFPDVFTRGFESELLIFHLHDWRLGLVDTRVDGSFTAAVTARRRRRGSSILVEE